MVDKIKKNRVKVLSKIVRQFDILNLTSIVPKRSSKKAGNPPGTIMYVGKKRTEKVKIQVIDYTKSGVKEFETEKVEDIFKFRDKKSVTWINVTGIHDVEIIKKIGKYFRLHPLLLEDVVSATQRPKLEEFDNDLFITLKMLYFNSKKNKIKIEQVSLVVGNGFVISFQEDAEDVFNLIRKRIREGGGRIRNAKSDYLTYTLIDSIVDNYFVVLEKIGDKIEDMEGKIFSEANNDVLNSIYKMKRELIVLRKSVWPLREVISAFQRGELKYIERDTAAYVRDVYDHTIQVIDTLETYRDMLSGMQDLYMSISGNKMNETMKVLTIIATIFIPLTFIAGIYGMNFNFMPELGYKYSYFIILGIMSIVASVMIFYFKRKKWM